MNKWIMLIFCSICEKHEGTVHRKDDLGLNNLVCQECADFIDRGVDVFNLIHLHREFRSDLNNA